MPLTKQYLRYVHQASFGVVSGRKSNAILLAGEGGRKTRQLRIIAPAVEDIIIWDPRKGEKVPSLVEAVGAGSMPRAEGCGCCKMNGAALSLAFQRMTFG